MDAEQQLVDVQDTLINGAVDGHKVDIYMPDNLPTPPAKSEILEKVDASLAPLIDLIYKFLETPVVEDDFGTDDEARDRWEKQVEVQLGMPGLEIIQQNRLRPNSYQEAASVLDALPDYLDRPDLKSIANKMDKRAFNPVDYKQLDLEEKHQVVNSIHQAAVEMLNAL
jgi:hypothetical protein